jgi:hypothetical protein
MTTEDITLNVFPAPEAVAPISTIVMTMEGITLGFGPEGALANIMIGPEGITLTSVGPINFVTPLVNIPIAQIGAGTVGGVAPLI